jgi:hypothetical protein
MQGTRFLAASIATSRPVIVDPVKQIISTGRRVTALATSIFPSITLKYSKLISPYLYPCIAQRVFLLRPKSLMLIN